MHDSSNDLPTAATGGEAAERPAPARESDGVEVDQVEGKPAAAPVTEDAAASAPETSPAEPSPSIMPDAGAPSYLINPPHELLAPDDEVNARLAAAGFTQQQAQLVYDLAAERLLPLIESALGEIRAEQELTKLQQHFGGEAAWRETSRQLKSWASANLTPEVAATLTASYDGILAMHQMMRAGEPELLATGADPAAEADEGALDQMVRDPRYWRRRDPEFIARVTAGFRRLFGD